jgi:hypothetical protein
MFVMGDYMFSKYDLAFPKNTVKRCIMCNKSINLRRSNLWVGVEIDQDHYIGNDDFDGDGSGYDFSIACLKCSVERKNEIEEALKFNDSIECDGPRWPF